MPCIVIVASAPPTWDRLTPYDAATGSTDAIAVVRSCMCIFPDATVATSWSVTDTALDAGSW